MRVSFNFGLVTAVVLAACCGNVTGEIFDPLFKVTSVVGDVKVFRPGSDAPEKVLEAHAYPYGSRLVVSKWDGKARTAKPELNFSLSADHKFKLAEGSDLAIINGEGDDSQKMIFDLASGKLKTFISVSTVKTGGAGDALIEAGINAIIVKTPLADCFKLTERNEIGVDYDGKNYSIFFATESGTMEVSGPQFKINSMRRNAAVEIFGNKDYTRITNVAGEFLGVIEKGIDATEVVSFKLRCVVKIWRRYAEIGGKMAVSVMTAYPDGTINSYAYLHGEKAVIDSATVLAGKEPAAAAVEAAPEEAPLDLGADEPAGESIEPTTEAVSSEKPKTPAAGELEVFNFDW